MKRICKDDRLKFISQILRPVILTTGDYYLNEVLTVIGKYSVNSSRIRIIKITKKLKWIIQFLNLDTGDTILLKVDHLGIRERYINDKYQLLGISKSKVR